MNTLYFKTHPRTRMCHCAIRTLRVVSGDSQSQSCRYTHTLFPQGLLFSQTQPFAAGLHQEGSDQVAQNSDNLKLVWEHRMTLPCQIGKSSLPTKALPIFPCQSLISASPPGGPYLAGSGHTFFHDERGRDAITSLLSSFTSRCYL